MGPGPHDGLVIDPGPTDNTTESPGDFAEILLAGCWLLAAGWLAGWLDGWLDEQQEELIERIGEGRERNLFLYSSSGCGKTIMLAEGVKIKVSQYKRLGREVRVHYRVVGTSTMGPGPEVGLIIDPGPTDNKPASPTGDFMPSSQWLTTIECKRREMGNDTEKKTWEKQMHVLEAQSGMVNMSNNRALNITMAMGHVSDSGPDSLPPIQQAMETTSSIDTLVPGSKLITSCHDTMPSTDKGLAIESGTPDEKLNSTRRSDSLDTLNIKEIILSKDEINRERTSQSPEGINQKLQLLELILEVFPLAVFQAAFLVQLSLGELTRRVGDAGESLSMRRMGNSGLSGALNILEDAAISEGGNRVHSKLITNMGDRRMEDYEMMASQVVPLLLAPAAALLATSTLQLHRGHSQGAEKKKKNGTEKLLKEKKTMALVAVEVAA